MSKDITARLLAPFAGQRWEWGDLYNNLTERIQDDASLMCRDLKAGPVLLDGERQGLLEERDGSGMWIVRALTPG